MGIFLNILSGILLLSLSVVYFPEGTLISIAVPLLLFSVGFGIGVLTDIIWK